MSSSKTPNLKTLVLAEARKHVLEKYLVSEPLVVGVSGGADSLGMLHLLRELRGAHAAATLHVAHLNHWIRGTEAKGDADFVKSTATTWGLPCSIGELDVPNFARREKLSMEEAARQARYAFFAGLAQANGAAVAVAHNADDQVETVLMSLLRGTGLAGLGGMRMLSSAPLPQNSSPFAGLAQYTPSQDTPLFRPLLGAWRWQILEYCKEVGLEPRFDSTNWERRYRRNRIRHDLLPVVQMQYSLAIKDHLYNLAQIAQGDEDALERQAQQISKAVVDWDAKRAIWRIFSQELAKLERGMQRRITRAGFEQVAGTMRDFSFKQVEGAIAVLAGEMGAPWAIHLPNGLVAERQGEYGYIRHRPPAGNAVRIRSAALEQVVERPIVEHDWQAGCFPEGELSTVTGWRLESAILDQHTPLPSNNLSAAFDLNKLLAMGEIRWRTRMPGDYILPMGMQGRKTLQDVMVDAKIPREQRDYIPVLASGDGNRVLWIPGEGGRRSSDGLVDPSTESVVMLKWSKEY